MTDKPVLTFGSVCSGMEAASCAWEPLGWRADWLAEIEAFPSAVLAHHFPTTPNLGDMTTIGAKIAKDEVSAPDVLVGGTPCQAYSMAGARKGLADERGLLTLKYIELADAIDNKRREAGKPPAAIVWENVPGVLTMADNAFGHFLAGLAGCDEAIEPGHRPESGKSTALWRWDAKAGSHVPKWPSTGHVTGPKRQVAWRVLDAQYFRVAQRRRRVFVVAGAGDDFNPGQVLFEFDGLRRDTPPSREPRSAVAALTANGVGTCGADDNQAQAGHIIATFDRQAIGKYGTEPVASTIRAVDYKGHTDLVLSVHGTQDPGVNAELAHTLGRNQGQENAIIAFNSKGHGTDATPDMSPTIRAGNSVNSNQNAGSPPAVAYLNGSGVAIRRLLPVECERLQGFPDDWTLIPWRKKAADNCPDGPRYKAIGNSMAVPVMRWIGERIMQQLVRCECPAADLIVEPTKKPARRKKSVAAGLSTEENPVNKPFLKWVGGKTSQLDDILPLLQGHQRLIEPFAGGGSVFLNAGLKTALINDNCADLINTYQQLQAEGHTVIVKAALMFRRFNDQDNFLKVREKFNAGRYTPVERAAAFIYLNRHCFNGLVRYNQKGEFNVGFGKYDAPHFPLLELENFLGCTDGMTFTCGDYAAAMKQAGAGDVLFCDPPYEPLPGEDGFTQYSNAGAFKLEDQAKVVKLAVEAHERGATVIITNSGAPSVRDLYLNAGFTVRDVMVKRSMSSRGGKKPRAKDVIATLIAQ